MSNVVLTGTFSRGSRKEVAEYLKSKGVTVAKGLSKAVDYLINGSKGSDAYSKGQYGSKHIKATQLGIKIASEDDFFNALERGAVSPDQIANVDMNVSQTDLEHNKPAYIGKERPKLTRIPGFEINMEYTNNAGELTTRRIGAISINPDIPYFYARSPGETQSRAFRYDRISDAVDIGTGEVIGDVEKYFKDFLKIAEEILDIKRRAGLLS